MLVTLDQNFKDWHGCSRLSKIMCSFLALQQSASSIKSNNRKSLLPYCSRRSQILA
ncbi:hypothetical protein HanXRQr2_Chr12g0537231 [Helianthus annuus]|uniref:Uncharacterized protein n=1 Tax=Helianthus annuus TaxID=4232 RepID=A0A9K3HFW1_HELAN|nr:hypothetical protein HanXRQr2_Chr12g0537231 [Helianthus annuus]KAJ0862362.1 hypothetical protein HanPSC8_Chr12g0517311 [Helianthus annuus]